MQIGLQDYPYTNVKDETVDAIKTIDYPHSEIHEGNAFLYCEVTDFSNGAVRDILIVTPNTTKWAHMVLDVVSELEADLKIYEAPTASNNGTAVTEFNRNRNSATVNTTVITHTPTIAGGSEGTLICQKHWGSGKANGGESRNLTELVLKQNTKYLLRVTNATTSANQIEIDLNWYEHTNGE